MACHPDPALAPEQEARVREIVAQMIGQALNGAGNRLIAPTVDAVEGADLRLACLKLALTLGYTDEDPRITADRLADYVRAGVKTERHRPASESRPCAATPSQIGGA